MESRRRRGRQTFDEIGDAELAEIRRRRNEANWDDNEESDPEPDLPSESIRAKYKEADVVGYTQFGRKILRKTSGESGTRVDEIIDREDDPDAFMRTVYDPIFDEERRIGDEQMDIIRRMQRGAFPHKGFNPEEVLYRFNYDGGDHPLTSLPLPKSHFTPSKHEMKKIAAIRQAIRDGTFKERHQTEEDTVAHYDVWTDAPEPAVKVGRLLPPRTSIPGHAESYNPPTEYLPTQDEANAWTEDPTKRPYDFTPVKYMALRQVPQYAQLMEERYARCQDLYLCPRVERPRMDIDPDSLLPDMPNPNQLRPYPEKLALTISRAHHGAQVRSISMSPSGQFMATGGQDGTVAIWELETGRCVARWLVGAEKAATAIDVTQPGEEEEAQVDGEAEGISHNQIFDPKGEADIGTNYWPVTGLVWVRARLNQKQAAEAIATDIPDESSNGEEVVEIVSSDEGSSEPTEAAETSESEPEMEEDDEDVPMVEYIAASAGRDVIIINPGLAIRDIVEKTTEHILSGERNEQFLDEPVAKQYGFCPDVRTGPLLRIHTSMLVVGIDVHVRGDYIAIAHRMKSRSAVAICRLSTGTSICPLAGQNGLVFNVKFGNVPGKQILFVGTEHGVSIYSIDPNSFGLMRRLHAAQAGSFTVHSRGSHVLIGTKEGRVLWFDRELLQDPIRTISQDHPVITSIEFARNRPLLATCSTDNGVRIFYGKIALESNGITEKVILAPCTVLRGHGGAARCASFDRHAPWVWTGASDGCLRLWINR